jgi:hypothetical protein
MLTESGVDGLYNYTRKAVINRRLETLSVKEVPYGIR